MIKRRLGRSDIEIAPFVLGTNVFGWTADEKTSFAILDAFVAEGFTAIDTADIYSRWVPGNESESEKIIGRWLKARGNRDKVHVFTKVGMDMGRGKEVDLSPVWIAEAVEGSLKRLQTDYIDLYQSHRFDPAVPQAETLAAYDKLIKAGKVRFIGASNFDENQLGEALRLSRDNGLPRYQTLQNEYNLYTRAKYEGALQDLVVKEEIGAIPFYALASGFLTGKYRSEADIGKSARGQGVKTKFLNDRGFRVLGAMDKVAAETGASLSEIALAWLVAQPGIAGPIASATSVDQLRDLMRGVRTTLAPAHLAMLSEIGS